MIKRLGPLLLLLVTSVPTFALEDADGAPEPLDALPGYWHFRHGDPVLGTLTAAGVAATFAPLLLPVADTGASDYWVERDDLHYFAWNEPGLASTDARRPLRGATTLAGIWGGFFSIYGAWDRYVKTDQAGRRAQYGNLTMADYLLAPFQPEFVFNFDVFPMFPLLPLAPLTIEDWKKVGGFFGRERVDFLGSKVSPAVGLGLTAAGALTLVAANATLEEIAFRGMALDRMGVVGSSLYFGANHLLNPFVLPNFSFEEAAQQATFATLFGLYAADRTRSHGGDFRRMIALHYWHNVTSLLLGYLIDPEHAQLFRITIPL